MTGEPASAIYSVSFSQRLKLFYVDYRTDRIDEKRLTASAARLCRFRRLTFDRIKKDEPVNFRYDESVSSELIEHFRKSRVRSFYCR